ncbi:MAG: hypothetical protein IH859_08670 [Chloroflexi bacterium]|nr:hypothetical protein [Chloroflexota bacterium]
MLWVIFFTLAASSAFITVFSITGELWNALNAAGVIAFIYLIGLIQRTTRPPVSNKVRKFSMIAAYILLFGVVAHWTIIYDQTNFQYRALHHVRKTIFHQVLHLTMHDIALNTLKTYYSRPESVREKITETFARLNPALSSNSSQIKIETFFEEDSLRIFIVFLSDTAIHLYGLSPTDGENPHFENFGGRIGRTQDFLALKTSGVFYEIQN